MRYSIATNFLPPPSPLRYRQHSFTLISALHALHKLQPSLYKPCTSTTTRNGTIPTTLPDHFLPLVYLHKHWSSLKDPGEGWIWHFGLSEFMDHFFGWIYRYVGVVNMVCCVFYRCPIQLRRYILSFYRSRLPLWLAFPHSRPTRQVFLGPSCPYVVLFETPTTPGHAAPSPHPLSWASQAC